MTRSDIKETAVYIQVRTVVWEDGAVRPLLPDRSVVLITTSVPDRRGNQMRSEEHGCDPSGARQQWPAVPQLFKSDHHRNQNHHPQVHSPENDLNQHQRPTAADTEQAVLPT